jgi:hypothetical protein
MPDPATSVPDDGSSDKSFLGWLKEVGLRADTVARSASDVATLGFADKVAAAGNALFDQSPGNWLDHYHSALDNETARNQYDSAHRRTAQAAGQALGIGLAAADAGVLGAESSAALPARAKGLLGEVLSAGKTIAKGDFPVGFQVPKQLANGRKTIVDQQTARGLNVEAKFGPWADLTKNQRFARRQWGSNYRVDRWLPEHVGYGTGAVGGAGGLLSASSFPPQTSSDPPQAAGSDDQSPDNQ